MNNRRNRWLLVALGVVVVFYFGELGYRKFFEEPATKNERLKEQLTQRLQKTKVDLAKAKRVALQLEALEQKSLPWDAEMARMRYQDWLLQLAKDAKLENTSVDASDPTAISQTDRKTRRSIEMYKRFTFQVRGRGELGQVTKFLYDFYRSGHLHKIRSMSLLPAGAQVVNVTLAVEALALPNADREAELTSLVSEELAMTNERDYHLIARRNFFGRGGANAAWKQIQLTAVIRDSQGNSEAWFAVGPSKQTEMLRIGQSLARPTFDLRVIELDEIAATATVAIETELFRLSIGNDLTEAVPLAEPPPE